MKKRLTAVFIALIMTFSLAGCGGVDLPMEVTVDGNTIVLGQTTMQDMIDLGYKVNSAGKQDAAKSGDKYISFGYTLTKEAGNQLFVTVYVPWSGNTNVSKEAELSATEGIIRTIELKKSALEKVTVTYNGMDLNDFTLNYAVDEWGAKQDERLINFLAYSVEAKNGFVRLSADGAFSEEFGELSLQIYDKVFESMQK